MEICLIDWILQSGRVRKMNLCQAELQVSIYYLSIALYLSSVNHHFLADCSIFNISQS